MATVIVSGALANKPSNGGGVWERLSWVGGLRRLGLDVYFVEQIAPQVCVDVKGAATPFAECVNLKWFQAVADRFGIADQSALVYGDGEECAGIAWPELIDLAGSAELLINLSGHLTLPDLVDRIRRKAYVDVDPGFTQFWHVDPSNAFQVGGHDFYFTIGENIGQLDCPIPTGGIEWRPIRQPVVLDDWPVTPAEERARFTTVASWRGPYGPVEYQGRTFGLKCHEFRKFIELPEKVKLTTEAQRAQRREQEGEPESRIQSRRAGTKSKIAPPPSPQPSPGERGGDALSEDRLPSPSPKHATAWEGHPPMTFEIALAIHAADEKDRRALFQHGWKIVEPRTVAGDAEAFRRYVQQSAAEFSVAQGVYVDTDSGWFSDRTVRYLASGKPALVQETGFSRHLPTGKGLIAFRTLDEAVQGAQRIMSDYDAHCQAARTFAEEYFDSDKVLARMLEEVGL